MGKLGYRCENKFGYRCENEWGPDPCEAARGGRIFSQEELAKAIDGGPPKCPGKTASGDLCDKALVQIPIGDGIPCWWRLALGGSVVLGIAALTTWAIWAFLLPSGEARLVVVSEPVFFSRGGSGGATGTLQLRNEGTGPLAVEGIDLSPPSFTVAKPTASIPPGGASTLTISYAPGLSSPSEGSLTLRTNDPRSPRTVRLVVNGDPWWVYKRLESTSTILSKEP